MDDLIANLSTQLGDIGEDIHVMREVAEEGTYYFYLDKVFQFMFASIFLAGARKLYRWSRKSGAKRENVPGADDTVVLTKYQKTDLSDLP